MKVSDLVPGSIYTPDPKTVTKDFHHVIVGSKRGTFSVTERVIWKSYRKVAAGEQHVYMYLGFTRDDWTVAYSGNIYKHHWFWINGEKIIVNNYSIRLLKEIKEWIDNTK